MEYAKILNDGIEARGFSLAQVCLKLANKGIWLDRAILSKLRNGKHSPAKDELNIALADVIGINPTELRVAAAKEIIGPELYELIKSTG